MKISLRVCLGGAAFEEKAQESRRPFRCIWNSGKNRNGRNEEKIHVIPDDEEEDQSVRSYLIPQDVKICVTEGERVQAGIGLP